MEEDNKSEEANNSVDNVSALNINQEKPLKIKRRITILAVILNFLAPGLGVYYAGNFVQGIIIALIWQLAFLFLGSIALLIEPEAYTAFILLSAIVLYISLTGHTISLCRKRNDNYVVRKANNPWYYILFVVVIFFYNRPLTKSTSEYFRISSASMEGTLKVDDIIEVKKTEYGIVLPYFGNKIKNTKHPERYDVATYRVSFPEGKSIYIHRIIGIPGDTIKIKNKEVYINGEIEKELPLLIHERYTPDENQINYRMYPKGAPWNEDFYGPLYIPRKGDVINLQKENKEMWRQLIIKDAGDAGEEFPEKILNNADYVIKNNYYFFMGDNRNNALDSRYTGLVTENDILGKADYIIFNKSYVNRIGIDVK